MAAVPLVDLTASQPPPVRASVLERMVELGALPEKLGLKHALLGSLVTRRWPFFHKVEDTDAFDELLYADIVHSTDGLLSTTIRTSLFDENWEKKLRLPNTEERLSLLEILLRSLEIDELKDLGCTAGVRFKTASMAKKSILEAIKTAYNGTQQTLVGTRNNTEKLAKIAEVWARPRNFVLVKESVLRAFLRLSYTLDPQAELAHKDRIPAVLVQSSFKHFCFPQITVNTTCKPQFESTDKLELHRVLSCIGHGCEQFDVSFLDSADIVQQMLEERLKNETELAEYLSLPNWLKQEHTMRKLASVLWHSVAVLERNKDFSKALDRLLILIDNPELGAESRRAKWLVRALVNCGHLKFTEIAKEIKVKAERMTLTEPGIFEVAKHFQRFMDKKETVQVIKGIEVKSETVVIEGANQRDYGWVETAAYEHAYATKWQKFLHCEGSVILRLFGLCMYDVLYSSNVGWIFRSPFQQLPSDLHENEVGMGLLSSVLVQLSVMSAERLAEHVAAQIERVGNCRTIGFNPDLDNDLPEISRCIGPATLSVCFERLLSNVYHWGGGLPDLLLWNPDSGCAKFVEVKGPGDSLSARQSFWLRTLASGGADACVLYVTDRPKDPKPKISKKRK